MIQSGSKPRACAVGLELAERVAAELEKGRILRYGHRDYCGMGLEIQDGVYVYAEVNDGYVALGAKDLGNRQNDDKERQEFASRAEFVAWLAAQTDESLSGRDQPQSWYHDNQRITISRLENFLLSPEELAARDRLHVRKMARVAIAKTTARLAVLGFTSEKRGSFSIVMDGYTCHLKLKMLKGSKNEYIAEASVGDDLDDCLSSEESFSLAIVGDSTELFAESVDTYVKKVVLPWFTSTIELSLNRT